MLAVIFDLDATLVDSQRVAAASFVDAYRVLGLTGEAPGDQFISMSGVPLEDVCTALGLPDTFSAAYRRCATERAPELRLFDGVTSMLDALVATGVRLAIITGKDRKRTLETLDQFGIGPYFDAVITPDDPPAPKPSAEGVVELCRIMQVQPSDTLVVGDSTLDIRCGVSAGSVSIGCTWGVARRAELFSAGATCVHDDISDLAACLDQRVAGTRRA